MASPKEIAVCIGCGCDDLHACVRDIPLDEIYQRDELGCFVVMPARELADLERCHWLRVDYAMAIGVCSECPDLVRAWDAVERWDLLMRRCS